jgi:hypothetical protein
MFGGNGQQRKESKSVAARATQRSSKRGAVLQGDSTVEAVKVGVQRVEHWKPRAAGNSGSRLSTATDQSKETDFKSVVHELYEAVGE